MKTGKLQSNYVMYSVEWAVRIIAGDSKCTLEKAYSIDRMFGVMVEQRLNQYKKELVLAKNFSVMCGVYGQMRDEYQDFGKYLSEEIEFFSKHGFDWYVHEMTEYYAGDEYAEEFVANNKDKIALNEMITRRITDLFTKSSDLSLARINQMPKQLSNNFKTMKQLAIDTASSIRFYNDQFLRQRYDAESTSRVQTETEFTEMENFYDSQTKLFTNIIQANTDEYQQTLNNTAEQIRRLLLDD